MRFDDLMRQKIKPGANIDIISDYNFFTGQVEEVGEDFIALKTKRGRVIINTNLLELRAVRIKEAKK